MLEPKGLSPPMNGVGKTHNCTRHNHSAAGSVERTSNTGIWNFRLLCLKKRRHGAPVPVTRIDAVLIFYPWERGVWNTMEARRHWEIAANDCWNLSSLHGLYRGITGAHAAVPSSSANRRA